MSCLCMGNQESWKRETINRHSRHIKKHGLANLEQGTSCHVKTHTECVYRLCILSWANEMGNSESVSGSRVVWNAGNDYMVGCLRGNKTEVCVWTMPWFSKWLNKSSHYLSRHISHLCCGKLQWAHASWAWLKNRQQHETAVELSTEKRDVLSVPTILVSFPGQDVVGH